MNLKALLKRMLPDKVRTSRYYLFYYWISFWNLFFAEKEIKDFKGVPIIINNFNRVSYLRDLIDCLIKRGYWNIYIIDNASTYPPLLDYYKDLEKGSVHVFHLEENLGFTAFTKSGLYKRFKNKFFVYTDSDIFLPDECPDDFIEHFFNILVSTPYTAKVGCALRIDDLPDCYALKSKVIEWESRYWKKPIGEDKYIAVIDTTIALYKPNIKVGIDYTGNRIRVAGKYTCKHQPWYIDSKNLSEEEQYYINSARQSTFWTKQNKQK